MSKAMYLLHGFNVSDGGDSTVNTMIPRLTSHGYTPRSIKYGWVGRMGVRFCNDNTAAVIASTVEPHSTIIAHSNGAALVYEAAELGAMFDHVILINPALDKHLAIKNAKRTTVYHAPSDPWTKLAAFIPFSNWGNMGAVGCRPRSGVLYRNVRNINLDRLTGLECGHSGVFATPLTRASLMRSIAYEMGRKR